VRFLWVLVGRATVFDREVVRVLTDIRSKAGVGDVLALISVVADKDGYPSLRVGGLSDEPSGCPTEFPVVGPDVAGAVRSGLIGDVRDDRLAPGFERLDRLAHQRVIRRD